MAYGSMLADTLQGSVAGIAPVFKDGNSTEIGQLNKAWVNFVGTSAVVNASFNTTSMTRAAAGSYSQALTVAVLDNKFTVTGATSAEGTYGNVTLFSSTTNTTTSVILYTADYNSPTKCDQTSVYANISR
jgi:hypothetical protein